MKRKWTLFLSILFVVAGVAAIALRIHGQEQKEPIGYEDTPMLPGGKWHVSDARRPHPPIVTPAPFGSEQPPSDAIVLFDGRNLSKWQSVSGGPARWTVKNGYFEVVPGTGDIETNQKFGAVQLHLEWAEPTPPTSSSQGRGNSGVFLQGQYETQVLDGYHNITYADGECGAVYAQHPPYVNACRPPGQWQSYDIVFTPAIWSSGSVSTPAYITTFQNGVLVQNHARIYGPTGFRIFPHYQTDTGPVGPLRLQDHHNRVRYRNIWIRTIKPPE